MNSSRSLRVLGASLVLLVAGCATTGTPTLDRSAPDEAYLTQRSIDRWNLLIGHEPAKAYDYLSPGYREIKSREAYVAEVSGRPMTWLGVEPAGVDCPPEAGYCDVSVNIRFKVRSGLPSVGAMESASPLTERWILSGKDWYFVPKEVARR